MAYKVKNAIGYIELNRRVIENVCGRSIAHFDGKLIPSDPKGRLRKSVVIPRTAQEEGFVRGRYNGELMDIELYLIIRLGNSMKELSGELAGDLREEVPKATGIELGTITVVFVGTLADKLSKRYIEFKYDRPA